jgi:hypothetical protein
MATDVLLDDHDGTWITLSAAVVSTSASAVMVENPDRRLPDSPEHRRALVHDKEDGLTVNFGDDYPGGLTLRGVVRITPKEVSKGVTPDLTIPPIKIPWDPWEGLGKLIPEKILADVSGGQDVRIEHVPNLVIDGGVQFIWNHGVGFSGSGKPAQQPVDLQSIIEDLRMQIADLQSRVEALGG